MSTTMDVAVAALPSRALRSLGNAETVARVVRDVFAASDFNDDDDDDDDDDDTRDGTLEGGEDEEEPTTTTTTTTWMPLANALRARTPVDAAREALRIGRALSRGGKRARRGDVEGDAFVGGGRTTTATTIPMERTPSRVDGLGEGLVTCARCSRAVYAERHAEHLRFRCDGGASAAGRDATTTKSTKSIAVTTTGSVLVRKGAVETAPRERAKSATVAASSAKQRQNAYGSAARLVPTPLAVRVSPSDARRAHDAIVFAGMCRAKTKIGGAFVDDS